jgi:D-alanyl-lipoteichoic acid acyltransferase DltB (MBOAT superfamily)
VLFVSNIFLFLFLPLAILFYYVIPVRGLRNAFLAFASLIFYAWGEPVFVFILMASIIVNYIGALLINYFRNTQAVKFILVFLMIIDLGILGTFKYLNFFLSQLGLIFHFNAVIAIALPLGISFYTFQIISYIIDVYRGKSHVQYNFVSFALYISMFPQLVAGPIVRYQTIAQQLAGRHENLDDFASGIHRFLIGFLKKILLANNMALIAEAAFSTVDVGRSVVYAWIGVLSYSFQIFFDFSGYSDMAIGLGSMFGFHFHENFDYPYIASSVSDFWRRWHISLGQWFRDYVYFPMGGSWVKTKSKLIINLLIVWGLTGLWHGASWNFILWGLWYFFLIAFEKLTGIPKCFKSAFMGILWRVFTLLSVLFGWVLFRAPGIRAAYRYIKSMFGFYGNAFFDDMVIYTLREYWLFLLFAVLCSMPVFKILRVKLESMPHPIQITVNITSTCFYLFAFLWSISFLILGTHNPFIYFNF